MREGRGSCALLRLAQSVACRGGYCADLGRLFVRLLLPWPPTLLALARHVACGPGDDTVFDYDSAIDTIVDCEVVRPGLLEQPRPSFLPLFTGVRGRGILRS